MFALRSSTQPSSSASKFGNANRDVCTMGVAIGVLPLSATGPSSRQMEMSWGSSCMGSKGPSPSARSQGDTCGAIEFAEPFGRSPSTRAEVLMRSWLVPFLILIPAALGAQERPIVLRAARMLDVEAGRIVNNVTVTVQNGRITAVNGAVPAGAETIDLGDVTLSPGLIDAHTHLAS